jgi:aminoglycoside phosphotransferase (APT) family kinase protein
MEFVTGRIFADIRMPELKDYSERKAAWRSAIETLAKLHRVDPLKIGLSDYGSHSDFYPRQIRSLYKLQKDQGAVKDEETGEAVGEIPNVEWLMSWYKDLVPKGELTIVHGDYKIDNFVSCYCFTFSHRRRRRLKHKLSLVSQSFADLPSNRASCYCRS